MSKEKDKPKEENPAPSKVERKKPQPAKLPLLVETVFTLPPLIILGADVVVVGLSYTAGADWVAILVRACVTTLVLGSVLLLFASLVSTGALESAREMRKKAEVGVKAKDSDGIKA